MKDQGKGREKEKEKKRKLNDEAALGAYVPQGPMLRDTENWNAPAFQVSYIHTHIDKQNNRIKTLIKKSIEWKLLIFKMKFIFLYIPFLQMILSLGTFSLLQKIWNPASFHWEGDESYGRR